jgi:hypothetical protein
MSEVRTVEATFDFDGTEVCVEIEGDFEPFVPAKINGPPENCYPAEGGVFSITEIHVVDSQGKRTGVALSLPPKIIEELESRYYEKLAEDSWADAYAD